MWHQLKHLTEQVLGLFGGCWEAFWKMVSATRMSVLFRAWHQPLSPFVAAFSSTSPGVKILKKKSFWITDVSQIPQHDNGQAFYTTLKANSQLRTPCEDEMWGKCVVNLHTSFSHMEISTRSPSASHCTHSHWLNIFELVLDYKGVNLNFANSVNRVAKKKRKKTKYFQCVWNLCVETA